MKKVAIFSFSSLFIFVSLFLTTKILASNSQASKIVTLQKGQTINGDYFAAGEIVEIYGVVNGDVYAAGGQVNINGEINGDLLVVGGSVTIAGEISDDVRAAGGQVNITANVGKNLTIASGNIELSDAAIIKGSVLALSGNTIINSPIGKDLNSFGGNLYLNSNIGRNVVTKVGALRITGNTQINGDLDYLAQDESQIDENAVIKGKTQKREQQMMAYDKAEKVQEGFNQMKNIFGTFLKVSSIFTALIIGWISIKFFPVYTKNSTHILKNNFAKSLGIGFVSMIVAPILVISFFATLIGYQIAFMLIIIIWFFVIFAKIYSMFYIGNLILRKYKKAKLYIQFLVGLLVFYLISMIPVIGFITIFILTTASIGALVINEIRTFRACKEESII